MGFSAPGSRTVWLSIATASGAGNKVMQSLHGGKLLEPFVDRYARAEYYLPLHRKDPVVWRFRTDLLSDPSL
jgi:hypothetical protein